MVKWIAPDLYPAKSDNTTIRQHNDQLFKNYKLLQQIDYLEEQENFGELLKWAIEYHDYGKANKNFCSKIQGKQSEELLFHHLISPLFFLEENHNLSQSDKFYVINAIIRHHSRQYELIKSALRFSNSSLRSRLIQIKDTLFKAFKNYEVLIDEYIDVLSLRNKVLNNPEGIKKNILITGLLIRLDHASSAGLEVEEEPIKEDRIVLFGNYINGKGLRSFQEKFKDKENVCIVADTGLGKTGLSVVWNKRKKFYVLPNRSSTNAMYETLRDIYGKGKIGLLHSTSLFYILDSNKDKEDEDISVVKDYEKTRILSKPVTVCTADQLFTAVFKYPTYEKIYATLAYSDVVIDEIQGFSPQQIVPIIQQIKDTKKLGTRYLVITATLPDIVAQELNKIGIDVISDDKDTIDTVKRHKIKIQQDLKISDLINDITKKFRDNKKVLVIVNTVGVAQDLYGKIEQILTENEQERLKLLHSRFVWKERWQKEADIKKHCRQNELGEYEDDKGYIWISTQLVEASLDIDFDYLFTEIAPIDSLIQRMGRVWRHRKMDYTGAPNVIIAGVAEGKGVDFVYEKCLRDKTLELLSKELEKGDYLLSVQKREMVSVLYNEGTLKLLGSKYLDEWKEIERVLDSGWEILMDAKSQKTFRDVLTIELIPWLYKDKVEKEYEKLKGIDPKLNKKERKRQRADILKNIQKYKCPVPIYYVTNYAKKKGISRPYESLDKQYEIAFLHKAFKYDEILGLTKEIEEVDDFDERCF